MKSRNSRLLINRQWPYMVQISMPGMMDTVLNLGLNDQVVTGLAARSGERFAYDSYRRFIDMFGGVVSDTSRKLSVG
jgi:pyruvate,orthophosphate dikinase